MREEVGQVLASIQTRFTLESPEQYVMRSLHCNSCGEYLGAYNTYYYPDGFPLKCSYCAAKQVEQPQPGPRRLTAKYLYYQFFLLLLVDYGHVYQRLLLRYHAAGVQLFL